jgi:hypothetical protein
MGGKRQPAGFSLAILDQIDSTIFSQDGLLRRSPFSARPSLTSSFHFDPLFTRPPTA